MVRDVGITSLNWFVCVLTAYGLHFGVKYVGCPMGEAVNMLSASEVLSSGLFGVVGSRFPRRSAYFWSGIALVGFALLTQYLSYLNNGSTFLSWCVALGLFFTKLCNGVMFSLVYIVTS